MTISELQALMDRTWPLLRSYAAAPAHPTATRLHAQAAGWSRVLGEHAATGTPVTASTQNGIRTWAAEVEAFVREQESSGAARSGSLLTPPSPSAGGVTALVILGMGVLAIAGAAMFVQQGMALSGDES
jgi:hypothetical protein